MTPPVGLPGRRRRLAWLVAPLVLVGLLASLVVLVELTARPAAEAYLAEQIEGSLPADVTGEVSVRLGGPFLIGQYLSGRLQEVRIASDDLVIADVPLRVRLRLQGVPIDPARPVEQASGAAVLDERSVEALLAQQGYPGEATIADGAVEYTDTTRVLGAELEYTITARPSLSGGRLHLDPRSARLDSGPVRLDATALLRLVAPDGMTVCLAELLPDVVALDSLLVGDGSGRLVFSGEDIVLSEEALARTGTCA